MVTGYKSLLCGFSMRAPARRIIQFELALCIRGNQCNCEYSACLFQHVIKVHLDAPLLASLVPARVFI